MVWKKDLAKLKQDLKTSEDAAPKRPMPKPVPKPAVPRELEEEDALFLAVMGKRKPDAPPDSDALPLPKRSPAKPPAEQTDFAEAMTALKGLKPVGSQKLPPPKEPAPLPEPRREEPAAPAEPQPAAPVVEKPRAPEPPRWTPPLIQLAAGMAVEVDGSLDLRGHSASDAIERMKERLLDGHLLGWRTFHVQLGASEELRQAFLAFLDGPEASLIARYAQAPIPMGGAQAWILYLGLQSSPH